MLLVASETGHVYTFATRKLQPMITSESGKALIQTCLNSPDPPVSQIPNPDQRMSATGYEETDLTYTVNENDAEKMQVRFIVWSRPIFWIVFIFHSSNYAYTREHKMTQRVWLKILLFLYEIFGEFSSMFFFPLHDLADPNIRQIYFISLSKYGKEKLLVGYFLCWSIFWAIRSHQPCVFAQSLHLPCILPCLYTTLAAKCSRKVFKLRVL